MPGKETPNQGGSHVGHLLYIVHLHQRPFNNIKKSILTPFCLLLLSCTPADPTLIKSWSKSPYFAASTSHDGLANVCILCAGSRSCSLHSSQASSPRQAWTLAYSKVSKPFHLNLALQTRNFSTWNAWPINYAQVGEFWTTPYMSLPMTTLAWAFPWPQTLGGQ